MDLKTRKLRAARREQIVHAVLRIIDEQGITALTTTILAKEIGVTSGALFRHFATRDEILQETVHYVASRIDHTFPDDSLPGTERLRQLAENRAKALTSEPGIAWFLHSDQAALTLPPAAVAVLKQRATRSRSFVLDAIDEGVTDGSIRNDIAPEHLLAVVMGTIHSFLVRKSPPGTTARSAPDIDGVVAALMRVIAPC